MIEGESESLKLETRDAHELIGEIEEYYFKLHYAQQQREAQRRRDELEMSQQATADRGTRIGQLLQHLSDGFSAMPILMTPPSEIALAYKAYKEGRGV